MKLRAALYLAAAFLAAALALTVLPACSDESDFDSDTDTGQTEADCLRICGNDCFLFSPGGECRCQDPCTCDDPPSC